MSSFTTSRIRRFIFAFAITATAVGCSSGGSVVPPSVNSLNSPTGPEVVSANSRASVASQAVAGRTTTSLNSVPKTGARPSYGPRVRVGPQASITCPSGPVYISPGTNVQSVVNSHSAGTKYCLEAGTFARQQITPKSGDVYVGVKGAILDGQNSASNAFIGGASSVTVKNLVITNYRVTAANDGAISIRWYGQSNWNIDNNEILNSAKVGVSVGSGASVVANYIHDNQEAGYYCGGTGATLTDNEIANNNPKNAYDNTHSAAGGKCLGSTNAVIEYNYVHGNHGTGIWDDTDNQGTEIAYNDVENNGFGGILHETSWDAAIFGNVVQNNESTAYCPSLDVWCSEIMIANSGGVHAKIVAVENNYVVSNAQRWGNGIMLMNENRGSGLYGPFLVQNVHVHNNDVNISAGGVTGAVTYNGDTGLFSTQGNSFNYDTYTGAGANAFYWKGGDGSFSWFQHEGQESRGSSH